MDKPEVVSLPKIFDPRGNLTFIQNGAQISFEIRRAYWIYDVPGGEERHGHAFRSASEMIVALSGSFDVVVDSGEGEERIHLNRSFNGVHVPPMTWRRLDNFSTNSVALVLSSTCYDEGDYIRDISEWRRLLSEGAGAGSGSAIAPSWESDISPRHSLDDCRIVELSRHCHPNGSLTAVDNIDNIFPVRRVFYLYDVHEFIIAASGSFDVTLTDGVDERKFSLNRPYKALYIPNGIWRSLDNFHRAQ